MSNTDIQVGINARLFPNNWRPLREEIAFARKHGFAYLQLPGPEQGLDAARLGGTIETVGALLRTDNVGTVMEMLILLGPEGRTAAGATPLEVLQANMPAIVGLGCERVHWHLARSGDYDAGAVQRVEAAMIAQLAAALELAKSHGFRFGLEHNKPGPGLFASVATFGSALAALPELGLVWDINHSPAQQHADFFKLAPRLSMLHISDTPLPNLNHHLPLGQGNLDLAAICRALLDGGFRGPAILEIGGQRFSGGFGQDTDAALIDSRARLLAMIE
jgi:sugar phosphate isomerase/epimerase